ncbi:MAG: DNA-directed RNA polymerase subunit beta'' [Alphaproteobacteria bacterium]|nr:DNA-directed RNA polymerase subunit beta'' [Alphaproteobacteria bacterium]
MIITRTITKKILENIVQETFSKFGNVSSSSLLDSLKFLGFYYATNAGISINIEDLKTPSVKKNFLKNAEDEVSFVSKQWEKGFVSDNERFQSIIDSWNSATDSLKNRIIEYYQNFDPVNNLYIMAFSGARGNISQVRQLVGMRGLMSDQEGKIIDLPIKTNFREGLSSIDYIISSYGARKGIVDTALKTADSGYLTRRLIFIAQDIIIREIDCHTSQGVIFFLNKETSINNLIGRILLKTDKKINSETQFSEKNNILNVEKLNRLKKNSPLILTVRSPLTCKANSSICQQCYGWDLAQQRIISLGEAVGIIAAQSIGEPGTQLTMRTFHTGGIFTSELLQQTVSPFSGKIIIPKDIQKTPYRTNHGMMVLRIQRETIIIILNWKGEKSEIKLEIGSFLYITTSTFIKKGQLIAEYSSRSILPGTRRLKPIKTPITGEVKFDNLVVLSKERQEDRPIIKVNQDDSILWIASGKIFSIPKEAKIEPSKILEKSKAIGHLNIVTPIPGYIVFDKNKITLFNHQQLHLDLENILNNIENYDLKFALFVKKYQYVDAHTIIGKIYFFSKTRGKVYAIKQKEARDHTILFFVTESDIWKLSTDHTITLSKNLQKMAYTGNLFNSGSLFNQSGYLISKTGFKLIFQRAYPIFLSPGAILKYKQGDFVYKNQTVATLVNTTQQNEDIVQGLPKIEELIEGRSPKRKAMISSGPSIVVPGGLCNKSLHWVRDNVFRQSKTIINSRQTNCDKYDQIDTLAEVLINSDYRINELSSNNFSKISNDSKKIKTRKKYIYINHWGRITRGTVLYNNKLWKLNPLKIKIKAQPKKSKPWEFFFTTLNNVPATFNSFRSSRKWIEVESNTGNQNVYFINPKPPYSLEKITELNILDEMYENVKTGDLIANTINNEQVYLQSVNLTTGIRLTPGICSFNHFGKLIDIGDIVSDGMLDPQILLNALNNYHTTTNNQIIGPQISITKFQLILVNSIQAIYQSQGVNIANKHIEIIVRQMTSKGRISYSGDTVFPINELITVDFLKKIQKKFVNIGYNPPIYQPILQSTTNASLDKKGFIAASGFQETRRILSRAAIEGKSDWLRGLKESVILGRLIPAGSAFLTYKNYLDKMYYFVDEKQKNTSNI